MVFGAKKQKVFLCLFDGVDSKNDLSFFNG